MHRGIPTININGWQIYPETTMRGFKAGGAFLEFEASTLNELRKAIWKHLLTVNEARRVLDLRIIDRLW